MSIVKRVAGAIAILSAFSAANAATVSLNGPVSVNQGDVFEVFIDSNWETTTLGGGFDIDWDPGVLTLLDSVVTAPGADPELSRPGDISDGNLNGVAFGSFDGLGGDVQVAMLTFEAIGPGFTLISVSPNFSPAGPPVDESGDPLANVNYLGTGIDVIALPSIGGSIAGINGFLARCINETTGQSVSISLGGSTSWNCTSAGFLASPGDSVLQFGAGSAAVAANLTGDLVGLNGIFAVCRNLTTAQLVPIPLGGAMVWDCNKAGFSAAPGEIVIQFSRGTVSAVTVTN